MTDIGQQSRATPHRVTRLLRRLGAGRVKGFVYHVLLRRPGRPVTPRVITQAQGMEVGDPLQFNSRSGMDLFFNDSDRVQDYLSAERIAFYEMVAARLPCRSGERVLDVGCGPGTLLRMLQSRYGIVAVGTDQSETAGHWARKNCAELQFFISDIYRVPLTPRSFDLVIATEVLEHLLYPARAVAALLPLLRPGGRFFATVPDGRADTFAGHINFWSYESFGVFAEPFGSARVERLPEGSLAMTVEA